MTGYKQERDKVPTRQKKLQRLGPYKNRRYLDGGLTMSRGESFPFFITEFITVFALGTIMWLTELTRPSTTYFHYLDL